MSAKLAGALCTDIVRSPLSNSYTPSPLAFDAGIATYAPFHHAESLVNANAPLRSRTMAAGGRNGYAIIVVLDTVSIRVFMPGSARRSIGNVPFTESS